uniref:Uncharacterized protein n=1 Tax=Glycine max TaxID=3847 RepID=C6T3Y8_SOYBN|nr:unknown [Glycine max]
MHGFWPSSSPSYANKYCTKFAFAKTNIATFAFTSNTASGQCSTFAYNPISSNHSNCSTGHSSTTCCHFTSKLPHSPNHYSFLPLLLPTTFSHHSLNEATLLIGYIGTRILGVWFWLSVIVGCISCCFYVVHVMVIYIVRCPFIAGEYL